MTLSLLSNSSDRFPVVLVSPRLRRSNASLERLLDGSWYAAAPTSSREALLMPQCRLRSARRGCAEGALHGLEDSPYPTRMRKAPPTSAGAQMSAGCADRRALTGTDPQTAGTDG